MNAFIVIGMNDRVSALVDGIGKCLPPNPDVHVGHLAGVISESEDGTYYCYDDYTNSSGAAGRSRLQDLSGFAGMVKNRVASFRNRFQTDQVNVFMLENPLSDEELDVMEQVFEDLDGQFGNDYLTRFHRIFFAYDVDNPDDGSRKVPKSVVKRYYEHAGKSKFTADVLYLDNTDVQGGAVTLDKEEHDFMLPRMLADFMVLLSETNTRQNIIRAISPQQTRTPDWYSIGYAESMFYFPDVENFYEHAGLMSLYESMLDDGDETVSSANVDDEEAMSVDIHPFGLIKRRDDRLKKYEDVPLGVDIRSFADSADYAIDEGLTALKDLLLGYIGENYGPGDFISRRIILEETGGLSEYKKQNFLKSAKGKYDMLVARAREDRFREYVAARNSTLPPQAPANPQTPASACPEEPPKDNPGWLARLCPWMRNRATDVTTAAPAPAPAPAVSDVRNPQIPPLECVDVIREQSELKDRYRDFLDRIDKIRQKAKQHKEYCDEFRLKTHSHHSFPLIDLEKLRQFLEKEAGSRCADIKDLWNATPFDQKNLACLEGLAREYSRKKAEEHTFIKVYEGGAQNPVFISETDSNLARICNDLNEKSLPFVPYRPTVPVAQNDITLAVYSDIKDFEERFERRRNEIKDGSRTNACRSEYAASKICFFQFLPLDDNALKDLIGANDGGLSGQEGGQP